MMHTRIHQPTTVGKGDVRAGRCRCSCRSPVSPRLRSLAWGRSMVIRARARMGHGHASKRPAQSQRQDQRRSRRLVRSPRRRDHL